MARNVILTTDADGKEIIKEILNPEIIVGEDGMFNGEKVTKRIIPRMRKIDGYDKTKHFKNYDIYNKEFKPFTMQDCDPPGSIQKR